MAVKIILAVLGIVIGYFLYGAYSDASDEAQFSKLFVTLFAGFYLGMLGVFYVLPGISQKAAQSMFSDSNQKSDHSLLHKARALMAQGDYESAVIAFRRALIKDPSNRMGWTEMAKLYAERLEQPQLAAACLREACDEHEWEEEDASFLLFRLSEWQVDECDDREAGAETLKEIVEKFPDSRHSANAIQQLRQLGYDVKAESV
jgi:tetratricopeptide (TPR) repeat protein